MIRTELVYCNCYVDGVVMSTKEKNLRTLLHHMRAQAVVGGLAEVKQERQLSRRPEVVVATPGRFWELAGTHAHLSHLKTLRHLVVDEADRMLERGHYPELKRLFAALGTPEEEEQRAKGDVFGRARAIEENDQARRGRMFGVGDGSGNGSGRHRLRRWGMRPVFENEGESSWTEGGTDGIDAMEDDSDDNDLSGNIPKVASTTAVESATSTAARVSSPARKFSRQTYVFSATLLTRGATGRRQQKRNGKAGARGTPDNNDDGKGEADPVAKIMRRLGVRGDPAVIDMGRRGIERHEGEKSAGYSSDAGSVRAAAAGNAATPMLPSTLRLCSIKSLQVRVSTRP